jgi:hypothetical protein
MGTWALSRGYSGRGVKLTTHLQLVPGSRKCGSIHPLPHTTSWHNASFVKHRDKFTFTKKKKEKEKTQQQQQQQHKSL